MTRLPAALLILSLLSLSQSLRAENEVYGGIGIGYSTFTVDARKFDGSGRATREFAGLRYGDYVAVELGYINFGTINDQVTLEPGQPGVNESIKTTGVNLSLVGRYPIDEELAAFGKLGVISWDSDSTIGSLPPPTGTDGKDPIFGLGLDYRGSGRFSVRVEAEYVDIGFADSWWLLSTSITYGIPFGR